MSSNWDEANLVHLAGKRAKKKRNKPANQQKPKNLVFNPFAVTYQTTPDNINMYTGSSLFSSMHRQHPQLQQITETIDLSSDMDYDNVQTTTPTHGKTKLLNNSINTLTLYGHIQCEFDFLILCR